MIAAKRLSSWFDNVQQRNGSLSREDVCFIMVQSRHLIEISGDKGKFRIASFYADWVVHSALDRSPVCFEMLKDLTERLAANFSPTSPDLTTQISAVIGFPKLRAEMKELFTSNNLSTAIFDYRENWKNFVSFLLWHILDNVITWSNPLRGQGKVIRANAQKLTRPRNIMVESLTIADWEGALHWVLKLSGDKDDVHVMGQIEIAEPEAAFLTLPQSR